MTWKLHETEKAFNLQQGNVFVLTNDDRNHSTNKIELAKDLKKQGLSVVKITSANSYKKTKVRGKKRKTVTMFRPKKWMVKLEAGQSVTPEMLPNLK